MRIIGNIKLSGLLIACSCFFISLKLSAQTESVQPKFKQVIVYIPKIKTARLPQKDNSLVIDSLKREINIYDSLYQKQHLQTKINEDIINELKQKITRQQKVNADLVSRVSKYETLNLQTRKNNFILMIFNSTVFILLFAMLIRYLINSRKKKSTVTVEHDRVASKEISNSDTFSEQNKIGHNLELLERIGKLRDKGILTEEEFTFQKQVILKKLN